MAARSTDKRWWKALEEPFNEPWTERGRCFKGQMTFTQRRKIDGERDGAIEGNASAHALATLSLSLSCVLCGISYERRDANAKRVAKIVSFFFFSSLPSPAFFFSLSPPPPPSFLFTTSFLRTRGKSRLQLFCRAQGNVTILQ